MHSAAVLGATGFGGAVAASILHRHPDVELTALTARSEAGRRHDELYPAYRVPLTMEEFDPDAIAERAERRARRLPAQGSGRRCQGAALAWPEGGGPLGRLPPRQGRL